jgi:hypothetical protein
VEPDFDQASLADAEAAVFVSGGRIVAKTSVGGRTILHVLAPTGAVVRDIDLAEAGRVLLGAQPAENALVVAVSKDPPPHPAWRSLEVDLETGAVVTIESGVFPTAVNHWMWTQVAAPAPGSLASRLFMSTDRRLLLRDTADGTLRPLVPARG